MSDTDTPVGMMTEEEFLAHAGITPDMTEDEIIEHFGVKGMKWGKRQPTNREANEPKGPSKGQQIREARLRVHTKTTEAEGKLFAGAAAVNKKYDMTVAQAKATRNKGADAVGRNFNKKIKDIEESEDGKLAAQTTAGEKAATAVLVGAYGAMAVGAIMILAKG